MKYPPKTLHRPKEVFDDNVSDLTMTHLDNTTVASADNSTSSSKKRNKLSKYLRMRTTNNKAVAVANKSEDGSASSGGAQRSRQAKNSAPATNSAPVVNRKSTMADQMVANMFSRTNQVKSSPLGIQRAQDWKREVDDLSSHVSVNSDQQSSRSMEYSSIDVTKQRSSGYRNEAVGAAAMAVEFGDNFSRGARMMKKQNSGEVDLMLSGRAKSSEEEESGLGRRKTVGDSVPHSKSTNNLSDLELLGQTVQCVNSALQSSTTSSANNHHYIASFKFNPRGCVWYASLIVVASDNERLCVPMKVTCHANDTTTKSSSATTTRTTYTVTISYMEHWTTVFHENFPTIDVTNQEELNSLWINHSVDICHGMEWLRDKLSRWIDRSSSFGGGDYSPDVRVVLPDMKQQQQQQQPRQQQQSGVRDNNNMVDLSLMKQHQDGGEQDVIQRPRSSSPKKNMRVGGSRSYDPSTTARTSTTCSMSSHTPSSRHSPGVEEEEEEGRMMQEARMELTGGKSIGNYKKGGDGGKGGVTKADESADKRDIGALVGRDRGFSNDSSGRGTSMNRGASLKSSVQAMGKFREGLVSQETMKRLLAEDEEREKERVIEAMESEHRAEGEIRAAKAGLVSRKTMLNMRNYRVNKEVDTSGKSGAGSSPRRSIPQAESDQLDNSKSSKSSDDVDVGDGHVLKREAFNTQGEFRQVRRGLVSQHTVKRLSASGQSSDVASNVDDNSFRPRRSFSQTEILQLQDELDNSKSSKSEEEYSKSSDEVHVGGGHVLKREAFNTQGEFRQVKTDGERRQARRGLISQRSFRRVSQDLSDNWLFPLWKGTDAQLDAWWEDQFDGLHITCPNQRKRMEDLGLVTPQDLLDLDIDALSRSLSTKVYDRSTKVYDRDGNVLGRTFDLSNRTSIRLEGMIKVVKHLHKIRRNITWNAIRWQVARKFVDDQEVLDTSARRTILPAENRGDMERVPSQIHVSFCDNSDSDIAQEEEKTAQAVEAVENKKAIAAVDNTTKNVVTTKKKVVSEDDDEDVGGLVFSNNALLQSKKLDVLTEGQYYLGISMLVYMYSHLRETCRMGHTRCSMHDIDTHSIQSQYKGGEATRYLKTTKTAGSIIRLVIDELEESNEDDADHEIVGGESKEYERQQTAQFRVWIDDSRISQMDEETEQMLREMKRKVARHRWKRAISAVRLSYRISGGKPPRWENPVAAPGCENCNRFVDMKEMMGEALRGQPKYFKEGSVMNNLIESGIEVVWFSDLSQNDVVYGICVNREEKKIIIVFRGTVNSHNWSMNFKFDTNEYRNPVKNNYPGREDELSLHAGFALYLLRKRKDTGMSKMDEIFEKVEQIGRELAPADDYKVCITGHSLGGALATLCGFYFGSKPRFAHLSTIYIWTFAAPRVGTQAFIRAYQYLERSGRIRHARFSCTNDIVPLIPFCNFEYDDLQFYKHVGMRIQLHDTGRIGKWRLRNNLDVTYPLKHDWPSEIRRQLMNNIFFNLNSPKGFKDFHGLTEHQRRLHFAMTYRKALGSSSLNSDQRRKRIKTLDEYYLIRADIATEGVAEEIVDIRKVDKVKKKGEPSSKWLVRFLVALLLLTWVLLIISITTDVPLQCLLVPFTMALHGIEHLIYLPVTIPSMLYESAKFQTHHMIHSMLGGTRHVGKSSFVARKTPSNIDVMKRLAAERVKYNASRQTKEIIDAKSLFRQDDSSRALLFDRTSMRLYNLASVVDNSAPPRLAIDMPAESTKYEEHGESSSDQVGDGSNDRAAELEAIESRLKPVQEYATSVSFAPKLDNGLYLVGAGVRKKSVVKVYAVAMYSEPRVLTGASSPTALHDAARTFDSTSSMTSFVLEMVYSAGAEKIAGAIGESVKPRHHGDTADIGKLEALIVEGVNAIGGQAVKGTKFRFDCSKEGVAVSVNGIEQGVATFEGLGSAFVDVFMDGNSVSPTLVDSCVSTWSTAESKSIASSLVELASFSGNLNQGDSKGGAADEKAVSAAMRKNVESQLKPIQEYATSVVFNPKLDEGLYLVGAGVRKKSVVKVYAVALYGSASVLNSASSPAALRTAARSFDVSTPLTSFVLEMTYSASAEKIGGAIADSVKPRYSGPASDISVLESLIIEGVNKKGGQATKGTTFRFDCSEDGVTVSVDGSVQGTANSAGLGSAFVDVFLDDDAVSPTLVSSCMDTWSNPQAKALAASILELGGASGETSSDEQEDEGSSSSLQNTIESNMKLIQEYSTSVSFGPTLDGLYLAGAGVRKKSIVKVYAVAMYSSPVVLQALSRESAAGMHNAARSFSPASPVTTFVLEMTYSAGAEKIAGAIAESVKPRYKGKQTDISELEALIVKGVNMKGGQASKGTIFRFDCSQEGVSVSVDGFDQGMAAFEGIGSAFVDVFLDENAVSPSLIDSCMETWSKVSL